MDALIVWKCVLIAVQRTTALIFVESTRLIDALCDYVVEVSCFAHTGCYSVVPFAGYSLFQFRNKIRF